MSNWTLEKIKNCEEIKFGTLFFKQGISESFVITCLHTLRYVGCGFDRIDSLYRDDGFELMRFYRPDGSEILPPEDEVNPVASAEINNSVRIDRLERMVERLNERVAKLNAFGVLE
jgi:hypothetical protein